jgi:hypothetical protein
MIDQSHMLSLLQAPRPDAPVLSLYVNLDPSHAAVLHRDLQIRVASLLDATQRTIQEPRLERLFETEKKRVQEFFADFEPTGKGFVLFSSLPQNLWVA